MVRAQPVYEARKGEKPRQVGALNLDQRLSMEKEITTRAAAFMKGNASEGQPSFADLSFALIHQQTLQNPQFSDKTGSGQQAD